MADAYSTLTATSYIECSREEFDALAADLETERRRLLNEDDMDFTIQAEFDEDEGAFIFAEDYFGDDDLTDGFSQAVGRFLSSTGHTYLEFSVSQTTTRVFPHSHGGMCFRIYRDGRIVWPTLVWT